MLLLSINSRPISLRHLHRLNSHAGAGAKTGLAVTHTKINHLNYLIITGSF
jgi:hypothetical protein